MSGGLKVKPEAYNNHQTQGQNSVPNGQWIASTELWIPDALQFNLPCCCAHLLRSTVFSFYIMRECKSCLKVLREHSKKLVVGIFQAMKVVIADTNSPGVLLTLQQITCIQKELIYLILEKAGSTVYPHFEDIPTNPDGCWSHTRIKELTKHVIKDYSKYLVLGINQLNIVQENKKFT